MPLLYKDRVAETTSTSGTGTYALNGASAGHQSFVDAIGDTNTCYYAVTDNSHWEVGLGTITDGAPDTLSRDTILDSSNGGAAVDWGSANKNIWCDFPASRITQLLKKDEDSTILGTLNIGDPGFEAAGIDIDGVVYAPEFRINDIGTANPAQMVMHRHSTTLQPLILGARANSETSTHAAVVAGQGLFSILGAGYTGSHYDIFGSIDIEVASGTISSTSSPGKVVIKATPNGSDAPVTQVAIDAVNTVISNSIKLSGSISETLTDNSLTISGGSGAALGGNIQLYGESHATLPDRIRVRQGTTTVLEINGSGGIDITNDAILGGHIRQLDTMKAYYGDDDDLSISHNGTDAYIINNTGDFNIRSKLNSGLIVIETDDSVGTLNKVAEFGGTTPKCDFYGDNVLSFSTKASSTYRTINFASIPTSATGLSAGDVWSNSGVLTIV
ncbi:MAG: hypothetical protein KAS32_11640 [Candidatus Peribacteraceae bacterium]|nr:hypothetical protein [Candidatus Peribacteraceae bacterium]